jgi:hypothetical protein
VSWSPARSGPAATGTVIGLFDKQAIGVQALVTCYARCTTQVFRGLTFGHTYGVVLASENAAGLSPSVWSAAVTIRQGCPALECVYIDTRQAIEPARQQAAGVLDSLSQVAAEAADLRAVRTTMWRGAPGVWPDGSYNWWVWDVAQAAGVPTTLVLSDLWGSPGQRPAPWSNWPAYSRWVSSTVKLVLASGRRVNYWDIQNEPGGGAGYLSLTDYLTSTPTDYLQQFLVAYHAIKAADPSARVIGPSLVNWADKPGEYNSHEFDMVTFLRFAAAHHMRLAAISWHEVSDMAGPSENTALPANVIDHVAEARRLVGSLRALGSPKIFVNEYGTSNNDTVPGWDVAYLAALTSSRVDSAGRACWRNDCGTPTLDGLLASDGSTRLQDYYVRQQYAAMTGTMVPTVASDDSLAGLASYDPSSRTLEALVGRGSSADAGGIPWGLLSPKPVTVEIAVPWTSGIVTVVLTQIVASVVIPKPPVQGPPMTLSVTNGVVTVTLPSVNDGDAYALTMTW